MRKAILKQARKLFVGVLTATVLLTSTPNIVKADTYDVDFEDYIEADYKNGYIDFANNKYSITIGTKRYIGNDERQYNDDTVWEKQRVKIKYHKGAEYKVTSSNPKVLKASVKGNYIYFEGISTGEATIYLKRKINGKFKTVDKITKKVQNTYIKLYDYEDSYKINQNYSIGGHQLNVKVVNPKYGYEYKVYTDNENVKVTTEDHGDGSFYYELNATKPGTYTLAFKEEKGNEKKLLKKLQIKVHKVKVLDKLVIKKQEGLGVTNFVKYLDTGYTIDLELINGNTIYDDVVYYSKHITLLEMNNPKYKNKQLLGIQNGNTAMFSKSGTYKVKVYKYPINKNNDTSDRVYLGTTTVTIK